MHDNVIVYSTVHRVELAIGVVRSICTGCKYSGVVYARARSDGAGTECKERKQWAIWGSTARPTHV